MKYVDSEKYTENRLKVAKELIHELMRVCPDSQQDPDAAQGNAAARAALRSAIETIEQRMTDGGRDDWGRGYAEGLRAGAQYLISAVEFEMYDPRSHPERYANAGWRQHLRESEDD